MLFFGLSFVSDHKNNTDALDFSHLAAGLGIVDVTGRFSLLKRKSTNILCQRGSVYFSLACSLYNDVVFFLCK